MVTKNMDTMDSVVNFDLRGPLKSLYIGPSGELTLVDRPSLKDKLEQMFPGCLIEDNRSNPDLNAARKSAAAIRDLYSTRSQALDASDDLSLG